MEKTSQLIIPDWLTPETAIPVVHACLVTETNKIWLEINQRLKWLSFLWGKQEPWETSIEWVKREILEETGLILWDSRFTIIDSGNVEYFEEMWKWFIWDLYRWEISNEVLFELERTRKNIDAWYLEEYKLLENKFFWRNTDAYEKKKMMIEKIEMCLEHSR